MKNQNLVVHGRVKCENLKAQNMIKYKKMDDKIGRNAFSFILEISGYILNMCMLNDFSVKFRHGMAIFKRKDASSGA